MISLDFVVKKYMFLAFVLTLLSCGLFDSEDGVSISTSGENLIIENNLGVKIYYNVMDNECAPYTDWIRTKSPDSIKPGQLKKIPFDDIYTDKDRKLSSGDRVEVVWWTDKYLDNSKMFSEKGSDTNGVEYITL